MRKLFGNSRRGASGGRYVAGKQAERRSAPVQPDVQRPEADDEEIPLLRDYANREAAQHRAETEENDIPLLQQYLKRPPLSQVMPQERHQAPAQPQQARPAAQQPQRRPAPQPAQSVPAPRAPRAYAPRPRREEVRDEDLTRDLPRTDAEAPRSGMNGKTRGLILLLAIFVITIGGFKLAVSASREFSALLGIPRSLVYSIAPISGIFIIIAQIINIYEDITGEKVDC